MAVHANALNLAADGIAENVTHLSLHTDTGGSNGSDEVTGGSYAKAEVGGDFTYGAATGGIANLEDPVEFGGPAAATVTHLGFWNGSDWLGSASLSAPKALTSSDTLTITAAPITVAVPS